ncbi:MAG: phage tail tape measure protein, partial [Patescibacteria group bacterium]|nr:phage tail tape measure protein [Patescibacteria group bacterium]
VLYKTVELARYSLKRLEDTGMEMAHLSIVFRGVGGSVAEVTNDMIKLAAAQGRETSETMESAIAWARLGGDRKTINEEVRVSAEAANIANMHMAETTKQLQSLMHIYNLEAGDLQGTLSGLVNTSLKYNVTLEELFTGLDRSSAAAKVAGVSLAELQAMIGVVVGATGQSGSMTGNSLKYIFQEISKPTVQRQLRGYGIEPLGNNLEIKPTGQILGEMSAMWGTLGPAAQQRMSTLLGGRFNAARVPVVMEKYPEILRLAIDAQLNLNKAQDANSKILDTLHAQLAGIRAEWDRLITNSNTMSAASTGAGFFKNLLGLAADAGAGLNLKSNPTLLDKTMAQWWSESPSFGKRFKDVMRAAGGTIFAGLPGMENTPGLFEYFNYIQKHKNEDQGQVEFQEQLSTLTGQSVAGGVRTRQFQNLVTRLRNGTLTPDAVNNYAMTMQDMTGGEGMAKAFLAAQKGGDRTGALAIAERVRDQAYQEQQQALKDRADLIQSNRDSLEKTKTDLEAKRSAMIAKGIGDQHPTEEWTKNEAAITANTKDLEDNTKAKDDNTAASEAMAGEIDAVAEALAQYGGQLKAVESLLQDLNKWQNATPAVTPMQALAREAAAAQDQLEMLTAAQKAFDAQAHTGMTKYAVQGVDAKFDEWIQAAQDALKSAQNPVRGMMAQKLTEQMAGVRASENVGIANDYGIDAAAKALNKLRALQRDRDTVLAGLKANPNDATLNGALQSDDTQVWQTKVDLAKQFAEVQAKIKQLAIDQNKEFMRSFFGDGPAQMLQKLAAFRMAFNGNGTRKSPLSQGVFFGLSPDMRNAYGKINPQYNPEMIELERERNRLNQSRPQWEKPGSPGVAPASGLAGAIAEWDKLKGLGSSAAGVLTDIANGLRSSGNSLVMVVANLAQRLNALMPGATGTSGVATGGQLPRPNGNNGTGIAAGMAVFHSAGGGKFHPAGSAAW